MPRYFFDLKNHPDIRDDDGVELSGEDEARVQAVMLIGAYLKDTPEMVWDGRRIRLEVRDTRGSVTFVVSVAAHAPGEA